ncbi:MAG: hypothetical protein KatS3mg077_1437 [Candidatus Binatia bacterium]|nr:MAG: hypothetical protein KatS3mg077_1437 [Candidatus Binatia bacterium]
MRWLASVCFALYAGVSLFGCGSSGDAVDGDDSLVFRVVGFSSEGITQADFVRPNSADVDVVQNFCVSTGGGGGGGGGQAQISLEPFTQTATNVVLRNDQKLDLRVFQVRIRFDDTRTGLGDITENVNGTVIGGRCSNASQRACASADDCLVGTVRGTCNFTDTTVSGVLLLDFLAKAAVQPRVYGEAQPVTLTFFARDTAGNVYRATAGYTITFDNFCNCETGQICCNSIEECLSLQQPAQ